MTSPPAGITVSLADESNLFQWKVTMEGPAGSPYAVCALSSYLSLTTLWVLLGTSPSIPEAFLTRPVNMGIHIYENARLIARQL